MQALQTVLLELHYFLKKVFGPNIYTQFYDSDKLYIFNNK